MGHRLEILLQLWRFPVQAEMIVSQSLRLALNR